MDEQQVQSRFFGTHIGCDVLIDDKDVYINAGCVFRKPNSQSSIPPMPFLNFYKPEQTGAVSMCAIHRCKLILRPLSSITDAEAIECAKMLGGNPCEWRVSFRDETRLEIVPIGYIGRISFRYSDIDRVEVVMAECNPTEIDTLAVFDWLRSRNFALPFMGHDPIAEGWAILDQKIPANAKKDLQEEV